MVSSHLSRPFSARQNKSKKAKRDAACNAKRLRAFAIVGYPVARGSVSSVRPNLFLGSHDSVIQRVNRPCFPPRPPSRGCFDTRTLLSVPCVESQGTPTSCGINQALSWRAHVCWCRVGEMMAGEAGVSVCGEIQHRRIISRALLATSCFSLVPSRLLMIQVASRHPTSFVSPWAPAPCVVCR